MQVAIQLQAVRRSRICGSNSIGRVPAFQAGCCEFEPRLPLHKSHSFEWLLCYERKTSAPPLTPSAL